MRFRLFSTNHKSIGLAYLFLAMIAVTTGIILSVLMRYHLAWPKGHLPFLACGTTPPEQYLALVTMHGTIMVFFVLSVAPQSAFGTYFLPLQIGAREMAFPTFSALGFWLTLAAFVVLLTAFVVP